MKTIITYFLYNEHCLICVSVNETNLFACVGSPEYSIDINGTKLAGERPVYKRPYFHRQASPYFHRQGATD